MHAITSGIKNNRKNTTYANDIVTQYFSGCGLWMCIPVCIIYSYKCIAAFFGTFSSPVCDIVYAFGHKCVGKQTITELFNYVKNNNKFITFISQVFWYGRHCRQRCCCRCTLILMYATKQSHIFVH